MRLLSTARRSRLLACAALLWVVEASFFYRWRWEPLPDESWFLHVANRFLHGAVLYRDTFLGVTPLSMYLAAGSVAVAGSQLLVLRVLMCLCFAVTLCLCAYQAQRAGASDRTILLMALAFPLFADPRPDSLYGEVSMLFFVAAGIAERPLLAGLFAGLAFASKQTVGVYAAAALAASWASEPRLFWKRAPAAAASFMAVAALILLPVAWSGGWSVFVREAFHKGLYMRAAAANYFREAQLDPRPFFSNQGGLRGFAYWMPRCKYLLPLALIPLGWRLIDTRDRLRTRAWIFGVFSLLLFYPRADDWHVRLAAPSLLIAAALVPLRPPRTWVAATLAIALAWPLCVWYLAPIYLWRRGVIVPAGLPHYRGVLLKAEVVEEWHRLLPGVRDAADRYGPMFLQTRTASEIYLAGDIPSWTPYDYPEVVVFGARGQQQTIADLESGRLRSVCLREDVTLAVTPSVLTDYVKTRMTAGPDLGMCRVYLPQRAGATLKP